MPADRTKRVTWREIAIHAVVLCAALVVLYPAVFVLGHALLPGELLYDFPPWKRLESAPVDTTPNKTLIESFLMFNMFYQTAARSLAIGEWPLWNPYEFAGIPLLANYQSAVFYPPRLLHAAMDIFWATTTYILLKVWLCGMTAYYCARQFDLSRAAARFVSFGWMMGGYVMVWTYWAVPDVAAWLPLLLLSAEWIVQERPRRGTALMTVSGALMLLAGHPESAFTGALGVALYFFIRVGQQRPNAPQLGKTLGAASAAWALALAYTAVQTLPFIEYLGQSHTLASRATAESDLHFVNRAAFIALFVPRFFGGNTEGNFDTSIAENSNFVHLAYSGVAVWLAIACLSFFREIPKLSQRRLAALAVPCAAGILTAFNVPPFGLVSRLPLLDASWGCYYLAFPLFALPLLGGHGIDAWTNRDRTFRDLVFPFAAAFAVSALVVITFVVQRERLAAADLTTFSLRQSLIAIAFATSAVGAAGLFIFTRRKALTANVFVLLLVVDLAYAARGLHETAPRDRLFPDTELTEFLVELETPHRVNSASAGIPTGLLESLGIEGQWAYDGILPQRPFDFFGRTHGAWWDGAEALTSTAYYLHDPSLDAAFDTTDRSRFRSLGAYDGVEVYENLDALRRTFLVPAVHVLDGPDALFAALTVPDFDPKEAALLEAPPPFHVDAARGKPVGISNVLSRTFTRVAVTVDTPEPVYLVLTDAYYPGWRATVNGVETSIAPAYHLFRCVPVPAGMSNVVFEYRPASFRIGLAVSSTSLILSAVGICLGIAWNRRKTRGN